MIDPATNASIANIAVGDDPRNLAVNPNRATVYVPNRGDDSVSVINTDTNTVTATITDASFDEPYAIAFNAAGSTAYVANKGNNVVAIINTATTTVTGTVTDSGGCVDSPEGIAINSFKPQGYIVGRQGDTVCVFNTTTNTVTATVAVGNNPRYATVNLDGSAVYISNDGSASVTKINTTDYPTTTIATNGGKPRNMTLSPDGAKLYVAMNDDFVSVVDTATDGVTEIYFTVSDLNYTYGIALVPGTNYGYVSSWSDLVGVFDVTTQQEVTGTGLPITQLDPNDSNVTFSDPKGVVSLGYVPTPPPADKLTQTAANGCVVVPSSKKIQKAGTWKIMKKNCVTNAGQKVKVSKVCRPTSRGDFRACRIVKKNGATYLWTYGNRIKATITWKASATDTYNAYKKVKKCQA